MSDIRLLKKKVRDLIERESTYLNSDRNEIEVLRSNERSIAYGNILVFIDDMIDEELGVPSRTLKLSCEL